MERNSSRTVTTVRISDSLIAMFGVVMSQLLLFTCLWLIGRFFGPEALGNFNFQTSLGMFLGTVLVLRYELSCITNSAESSFHAVCNVFVLALANSALILLLLYGTGQQRYAIVVLFAFSFIIIQTFANYLNTLRKYFAISLFRFTANLLLLLLLCLFIYQHIKQMDQFFYYALIYAAIATAVFAYVAYQKLSRREPLHLVAFLKEHHRYPKYIFPATFCSAIYTYSLAILVPFWYGMTEAGYFTLAYKIGFFPLALLSQSISGVFRRDMLESIELSACSTRQVYFTYMRYMAVLMVLYLIGGYLLFNSIVSFCFGQNWQSSSHYFYLMMPLFCMQILYAPASQLFLVFKKQKVDLIMNMVMGGSLAILFVTNQLLGFSLSTLILLYALICAAVLLGNLYLTYKMVMNYDCLRR